MFSFSLYKYPRVELLDHMVVLFLIFWGTTILFSKVLHQFTFPPTVHKGPFSPHPWQHLLFLSFWWLPFWQVQLVKSLPTSAGDARDVDLIPGLGKSLGEGNGNPLQCSYLENSMDRGAQQATVHGSLRVGHNWARVHTCILTGVTWFLMTLICIFLILSDVERLSCVCWTCVFIALQKCLFWSSIHF